MSINDQQNPLVINKSFVSDIEESDHQNGPLRYLILALVAALGLGLFFVYDNPAVLESELKSVKAT